MTDFDGDDKLDLDWDDDDFDWDSALDEWASELDRVTSRPPPPAEPPPQAGPQKQPELSAPEQPVEAASPFAKTQPPVPEPKAPEGKAPLYRPPSVPASRASLGSKRVSSQAPARTSPEPEASPGRPSLTPTHPDELGKALSASEEPARPSSLGKEGETGRLEGVSDLDFGNDIDRLFDNLEARGLPSDLDGALAGVPDADLATTLEGDFTEDLGGSVPPSSRPGSDEGFTTSLGDEPGGSFTIPAPPPVTVDVTSINEEDAGVDGGPSSLSGRDPATTGVAQEALALDHFPDPNSVDLQLHPGISGDTDPAPAAESVLRPSGVPPRKTPPPAQPLSRLEPQPQPEPIASQHPSAAPELIIGDSEPPELTITEGDDEEDWDEPTVDSSAVAEEADRAGADVGAQVAMRTVRYRKPRKEVFPLVGTGAEVLASRAELLRALAHSARGSERARLFSAAATLMAELGDADQMEDCYRQAREADPTDIVALRALRKRAVGRSDWPVAAQLLEAELKLKLSPEDKLAAFMLLAEIQRSKLNDVEAASRTARSALGVRRDSVSAALLLAELSAIAARPGDVAMALERAGENWDDPKATSTLFVMLARAAEGRGQGERARALYERSLGAHVSLEGLFGYVRNARQTQHPESAVMGLVAATLWFSGAPTAERFLRCAALVTSHQLSKPADAMVALRSTRQPLTQQTRAQLAVQLGLHDEAQQAFQAWASASGGAERARALVDAADLHAHSEAWEKAAEALREASQAEASFGLISVARDVMARRSGGLVQRSEDVSSGSLDSMRKAAKLARSGDNPAEERRLLDEVRESSAAADVLFTDLCALAGDREAALEGIRRAADRATGGNKLGPLLVLAEEAESRSQPVQELALLQEANEAVHGSPLVLRRLAQLQRGRDVAAAAQCWLTEADHAPPARAAFAMTMAGRLWLRAQRTDSNEAGEALMSHAAEKAENCFRKALRVKPGYWPSLWYLEPAARRRGDFDAVAELNEQPLQEGVPGVLSAARFVRAALIRADEDRGRAGVLLLRARELCGEDQVLQELLLRLGDGLSNSAKAELLVHSAGVAPEPLREPAWLRAAGAYEDAEEFEKAADIYRKIVAGAEANPAAVRGYDRVQLSSGALEEVAERRKENVESAKTPSLRARALEDLASFYDREESSPDNAAETYEQILQVAEGHIPSLRALERHFMRTGNDPKLLNIEKQLARQTLGSSDSVAQLRLAHRLATRAENAPADVADEDLLTLTSREETSAWAAQRAYGAALARDDQRAAADFMKIQIRKLNSPREAAAATLYLEEALNKLSEPEEATAAFQAVVDRFGTTELCSAHTVFAERLARSLRQNNQVENAAVAFEASANGSPDARRSAMLNYEAGRLWESVGKADLAIKAYGAAAKTDVTHRDLFDRLRNLLEAKGDDEALIELIRVRLNTKREPAVMKELFGDLATLELKRGNRREARRALRHSLSIDPENVPLLRELARLALEDEDWRGAAEPLIRVARISRSRSELRDVFFTIGTLYDQHMPDARRAEAAFRRVLKLDPNHLAALERLVAIYERTEQLGPAVESLKRLIELEQDPQQVVRHKLRLASCFERRADMRRAESILEETRRDHPTNVEVIRHMADFYQQQDAGPALSVHLKRAVNDLRGELLQDPANEAMWSSLIDVLRWRGREHAAAAVASASAAFGVLPASHAPLVSQWGERPARAGSALDNKFDDLLSPAALSPVTVTVFKMAAAAFEKCLPFSAKQFEAQKQSARSRSIAYLFDAAREWDVRDLQLLTTTRAKGVFAPISATPTTILADTELITQATQDEALFLLFRAIKIAKTGLSVTVRSRPDQLELAVTALVRMFDASFTIPGIDETTLQSMTDRMARAIPRRNRDELMPLTIEMAGMQDFSPLNLGNLASELGNRAALSGLGSLPAAHGALFRLAGMSVHRSNTEAVIEAAGRLPEARALLEFALSDTYFEMRQRLLDEAG